MTVGRSAGSPWLVPALGVAAWLSFSAGLRPLALPDEGRYVGVAWEMLRSGQWLVPTLDGLPFFHKPPLFYWITAASLSLLGLGAWPARLASMLGAAVTVLALYALLRRWSDARIARWAVVILATQPLLFGAAQFANLDMLVAGCITATIALVAHAALCLDSGQPAPRWALPAAYAAAALGVLAKGLVGALLPAVIVATWLVLARRTRLIAPLLSLPGALLFAAIALPWFVAMSERFDGFLHSFFVYHHFQRFTQSGFNNEQPFWFYLPVIALLTLPWSAALPALWKAPPPPDGPRRLLRGLMWVWAIGIVAFFSAPRSKLVGYVLPALPALAALIAEAVWSRSGDAARTARRLRGVAALAAVACVAAIVAIALHDKQSTESLGRVLRERRASDDPVFFVGDYFYDLPLHARLAQPVYVVEAWHAPDIAARDNWRRELAEAARFAGAPAQQSLVDRADFAHAVCAHPVSWVVASARTAAQQPLLWQEAPLTSSQRASLWRIDAQRCASMPPSRVARTPSAG